MTPNLIALAVPFFFLLIGIELLVAWRRRARVYRLADALADLGCGIGQQVTQLFYSAALLLLYGWVHQRYSLVRFPEGSVWPWLIAFGGVELVYYWWHRWSHEVNLLWAAHVVHHQSEDYNLAVALRQSVLTSLTIFPLNLTLAFVGVPPLHFAIAAAVSTLYQFWIHTQLVGRLGWFEAVFNTPSAHRVHHAINPRYIDKNYGGILIVFDRLFGTYEPEVEPPVYGLVGPLRSFNPLWAQVERVVGLARRSARAPRWGDKLRVWLEGPQWHIPGLEEPHPPPPVSPDGYVKYDVQPSRAQALYALAQFGVVVTATFLLMLLGRALPLWQLAPGAGLILVSLATVGGLLEQRAWARPLELARLALMVAAGAAVLAGGLQPVAGAALVAAGAGSLLWVARLKAPARPQPVRA